MHRDLMCNDVPGSMAMTSPIDTFYPTPRSLVDKMLAGIDFMLIDSILEPSAGKGDIIDAISQKMRQIKGRSYNYDSRCPYCPNIDAVEINPDLRHVLTGKGYRVVHDDYLTYETYKHYDLIVMNPPFAQGEKHLLKALEMQKSGGAIICILNAETIRNPNNIIRVTVNNLLKKYEASIEYLKDEFTKAERKTNVEIALIKVDIPEVETESIILTSLEVAKNIRSVEPEDPKAITDVEYARAAIAHYQYEARAGIQLIKDFRAMQPTLTQSFSEQYPTHILTLSFGGENNYGREIPHENEYLRKVRAKYWNTLFMSPKFTQQFTSDLVTMCRADVDRLRDYEFSEYNIREINIMLVNRLTKAIEDTIIRLFDEFSNKHHWFDEMSQNIHYFNGWKTNKAWIVGKKVIIPNRLYSALTDHYCYASDARLEIADIEKTLNYLSTGIKHDSVYTSLEAASKMGKTRNIETAYFTLSCYKKGTVHITFKDENLLKKFNIFGAQHKGWLPPVYGKVTYDNLEDEEKSVIESFEGEKSYNSTMNNPGYYLSGVELLDMGK